MHMLRNFEILHRSKLDVSYQFGFGYLCDGFAMPRNMQRQYIDAHTSDNMVINRVFFGSGSPPPPPLIWLPCNQFAFLKKIKR